MRSTNRAPLNGMSLKATGRRAVSAAAAVTASIALANAAFGQATKYFDQNGTGSGLGSGTGTWSATSAVWATSASPGTAAPGTWVGGSIASFNAGFTVNVADTELVGGLTFVSGGTTIGVTGTGPWALDFGSNPFTITQSTTSKQIIAVPIQGSGDMTILGTNTSSTGSQPVDLAGVMTGFTGNNIYVNNNPTGTINSTNATQLQLDSPLGLSTTKINLDQWTTLACNNQVTGAGTAGDPLTGNAQATPNIYTIANPIVLNYKGVVNNTTNTIGVSNGPSVTVNGVTTTYSKIVTFAGVISSPAGVTTNLKISGPRGTTVLAAQNTYNGSTIVDSGNNNGMLVLAVDNAIPATSALIIGNGNDIIGPIDLSGHNQTIASLNTAGTNTTANGVGNFYNLQISNPAHNFSSNPNGNPASITITPATTTNTTYKGDIGDTNTATNPFNNNAPYNDGSLVANTNISLVLNGPTGGGTHTLTLAPISALPNGNEYSGTTTVNSNAVLAFGRTNTFSGTPGNAYTITGNGDVIVNSGGTVSSVATNASTYAGGAAGNIILTNGAIMTPGGTGTTGILSSNAITFNSGASIKFDFTNASSFDSVYLNGGLTLDSSSATHTIKLSLTNTGTLVPGTYNLINGSIYGDAPNAGAFVLDSSSITTADTLKLINTGSALQLQILAPALRWDPTGDGASSGHVAEQGGDWDNSARFVNLLNSTEVTWNNADYLSSTNASHTNYDVIIGSDVNQAGGTINLGQNVTVGGQITFGPIFPPTGGFGNNYVIAGNGYSLTLGDPGNHTGGGIAVNNIAAGSTNPSAEIDAPIILAADQTWSVDSGQFFDVKGSVTGSFALTKAGSGVVYLESPGGSIGSLAVNGGTILLGAADSVGTTAPISLNGGALEYTTDGTVANPFSTGTSGGSIGATNQPNGGAPYNVTLTGNITGGNPLTVIGSGNVTVNGNITASAFTSSGLTTVGGGNVTLNGTNTFSTINVNGGGTLTLNASNTISTSVNLSNGTLVAASPAALGGTTAPPVINFTPSNTTVVPTLSVPGFTSLVNNVNIGTNGSAQMGITATVPITLSGVISGAGNLRLTGPEFTITGANTNGNSVDFETSGMTVHAASATAFGTATIAPDADSTLDAQVDVSANGYRSSNSVTTMTKTGTGTLTITGAAGITSKPGSAIVINQGAIRMMNAGSLGGTPSSGTAVYVDLTLNSGTTLYAHFGSGSHSSGNITLNNATLVREDGFTGETTFASTSATNGLITVNGNSVIQNNDTNTTNTNEIFGITNPVLVTTGSNLTLRMDALTGYPGNHAIDFRGPSTLTGASADTYINFKIQHGATVTQVGQGELRFGRIGSQGIAIIGQGTSGAGNDSVLKLGQDTWMTDIASPMITGFVVNGSGTGGLHIEAPMNAAYVDPSTSPPASQPIGTTGLFGTDPYAGQPNHTNGNPYTVLSPNRASALSTTYSDVNGTYTPGGTLTLAANDAAGATGVINVGPSAPCNVTLALDNTATSGDLVYQFDGQAANGAKLANFAGVTIQHSNAGHTVKGQLKSSTHLAALTLSDTTFDIVNHALAVESVGSIIFYLPSHTLYSSSVDADAQGITTIAVVNGADLGGMTSFAGINNITSSTTIYAAAYYGDINLDGKVDADDYALMDRSFAMHLPANWIDGDFNNSGAVDSADYMLMDKAFALSNGVPLSPGFLAQREAQFGSEYVTQLLTSIPEPSLLLSSTICLAATLSGRRRRR